MGGSRGVQYRHRGEWRQSSREQVIWGHTVLVVGYDKALEITNRQCNKKTKDAFCIRNFWGTSWEGRVTAGCPSTTYWQLWPLTGL
jgi:hypothetical protein